MRQAAATPTPVRWESPAPAARAVIAAPCAAPQSDPRPLRLWTQDESRFGLRSILRRRITLKGVKPLVTVQQEYANYYLYGPYLGLPEREDLTLALWLEAISEERQSTGPAPLPRPG